MILSPSSCFSIFQPIKSDQYQLFQKCSCLIYIILYLTMWRAKIPTQKTSNLCNQFLVTYLIKKKVQLQKIGIDRKAIVYNTAIISIKKYPLPIISPKQLKLIYGIGDLLCQQLTNVIKSHYRQFLRQKGNDKYEEKAQQISQNVENVDQNTMNKCHSLSLMSGHGNFNRRMEKDYDEDARSVNSVRSAICDKPYKPRPKTHAAYILIALRNLAQDQFVDDQALKQHLKIVYEQNIGKKPFSLAITNLAKSQYIVQDVQNKNVIKLTSKGLIEVDHLQAKTKIKDTQSKIKSVLSSFLSNNHEKRRDLDKKPDKKSKQLFEYEVQSGKQLVLLIDSRQIKDQQQQNFFNLKLSQKYGILCKSVNLPLGDFLWMYDGQILDYIVERKKADDLVSSIFDGRYKQQKYRLKNSGFTNIYYLFEGHLTGNNAKSERQVMGALLKTRVKDEFKVIQVNTISESVKFIHFITQTIRNKIQSDRKIQSLGTLEEFTLNNGKTSNLTVQHIFGLSIKTIPGVGKNSVNEILKYFMSFKSLYDQMRELSNRIERIEFIKQLIKGCGVQKMVPELLVDLLFDNLSQ